MLSSLVESIRTIDKSDSSSEDIALLSAKCSTVSSILLFLVIPAVSIISILWPLNSTTLFTLSLVVPAISETIDLFSWVIAFKSELLPEFGWPIIESLKYGLTLSVSKFKYLRHWSKTSPIPLPCNALILKTWSAPSEYHP